ncbi:MAG: hypothetical protein J6J24_00570, partial [Clostridia bacterium]|nr:hypothetical protein [Clostridia bacterium]
MNDKKQNGFKISYLVVFLVVALLFSLLFIDFGNNGYQLSLGDVDKLVAGEFVDEDGTTQKAEFLFYKNGKGYILVEGSKYKPNQAPSYSDYYFEYDASGADDYIADLVKDCKANGVDPIYIPTGINFWDILVPILYVCFAIFMFFMLFKMMSGANKGAMNFGKTKVKTYQMSKVRFSDIAGMDEEKAELQEIVEFLKNPKKFTDLGARIPKGVLL